ncbi:MAG: tricarballylate utilization 4Fe-4S protein TcuB [Neptuniibacter sp.]
MQTIAVVNLDNIAEARRQLEICNACRYCESYCSVFPAVHREREFTDENVMQIANLCHNCRGCYYACQYTAPHEFGLNVPKALAEVRQDSWQDNAAPSVLAKAFHHSGTLISAFVIVAIAVLIWMIQGGSSVEGEGFYKLMPHNAMVFLFAPAFIIPVVMITMGIRKYWRTVGGEPLRLAQIKSALAEVGKMKNLAAGHGDGCNFEDEDRFSHARRYFHQATMYGFLLCFAATSVATLMHYLFSWPAPYELLSPPKLLGVPGGILLSIGTAGLAWLKLQADKDLGAKRVWGGEMAFVVMLFFVSTTGLALYWLGDTAWLPELLAIHLGSVLAFFLLMPYSKMVHGFYRLAAILREEQKKTS